MNSATYELQVSDNGGRTYRTVATGLDAQDVQTITARMVAERTQKPMRPGKDFRLVEEC